MTKMFKIFQIEVTDELHDHINATGWDDPISKRYLDATFGKIDSAVEAGMFKHVANIQAEDLDDVFHIGNVGPESRIERLAPMTSLSVGNVIGDEDGNFHVVASFGFEPVTNFKAGA